MDKKNKTNLQYFSIILPLIVFSLAAFITVCLLANCSINPKDDFILYQKQVKDDIEREDISF